jgi:hypothetical protein
VASDDIMFVRERAFWGSCGGTSANDLILEVAATALYGDENGQTNKSRDCSPSFASPPSSYSCHILLHRFREYYTITAILVSAVRNDGLARFDGLHSRVQTRDRAFLDSLAHEILEDAMTTLKHQYVIFGLAGGFSDLDRTIAPATTNHMGSFR